MASHRSRSVIRLAKGLLLTLPFAEAKVKHILHISIEDVHTTRQIVEAGKLLNIDVLDHLVIGHNGRWVSLKERGLGF